MLATALLERQHVLQWQTKEGTREVSAWARDFGSERAQAWGRWRHAAPLGDPLHCAAPHWRRPGSTLIAEPVAKGGLGMTPEPWLLSAGVVAVGHMCRTSVDSAGRTTHAWLTDYDAARRANRRLSSHGVAEAAWKRQLAALAAAGVEPEGGERVPPMGTGRLAAAWAGNKPTAAGCEVQTEEVQRVLAALEKPEVRRGRDKESWSRDLRKCFPGAPRRSAREWVHGTRDRGGEAEGARCLLCIDGKVEAFGGEARWCARSQATYEPPETAFWDDEELMVGDDGWVAGHELEQARLRAMAELDEEGFVLGAQGDRVQGEELGNLPPAVQMIARARIEVACLAPEAAVIDEWPPTKRKKTHINLAVQRRNRDELVKWQAKVRATAVYTLDGTRLMAKGPSGQAEFVVARAAVRHDGVIISGRIREVEGADNYLAELAAQLDAMEAEEAGGRVVVVFDATSPVLAMKKFRRLCHRRRQGYYAGEWLESLFRLVDRQEVVVFIWQTSHVGSPTNEWADLAAGAAGSDGEELAVVRVASQSASMLYTRPAKTLRAWAGKLAAEAVHGRLCRECHSPNASEGGTAQFRDEYDMAPFALPDEAQGVCEAVLSQRSVMGDAKRYVSRVRLDMLGGGLCPFGCETQNGGRVRFTWLHAQCFCRHPALVEARGAWLDGCREAAEALRVDGLEHRQLAETIKLIERGVPRAQGEEIQGGDIADTVARGPGAAVRTRLLEVHARRLTGGCVRERAEKAKDRSVRRLATSMVMAGVQVQLVARELTKDIEAAALKEAAAMQRVRKFGNHWLYVTRSGGPERVAALRAAAVAVDRATQTVLNYARTRLMSIEDATAAIEALETEGDPLRIVKGSVICGMIETARYSFPRMRDRAFMQWRVLALARRWRLRAALSQRRWDGVEDPAAEEGGCERIRAEGVRASLVDEVAVEAFWQATGLAPAVGYAAPQRDELMQMEQAAARKWLAGGGWKGECRRRAAEQRARKKQAASRVQQQLVRQGAKFRVYMSGGAAEGVGFSGAPLEGSEGGRVFLTIAPRQVKRKARAPTQERPRSAARTAFESGATADRWNKWVVDRVLEVHRVRQGTRAGAAAGQLRFRVRWQGKNPASGLPWPDTWEQLYEVSTVKGKTRKVLTVNGHMLAAVRAMEATKYGTTLATGGRKRKAQPIEGATQQRGKRLRKWDRALRGGDGDVEAVHWWQGGRHVRRHASVAGDGEGGRPGSADVTAMALRDIRRQRAGTREKAALERKRQERRVVGSDTSSSEG